MSANPYAPPTARVDDVGQTGAAPSLWNPNAAANWSLLFSPAFGAWLHMKNWRALGESERAEGSRRWIIISLVLVVGASLASGLMPDSKAIDGASRTFALVLLIAWYFSSARAQAAYIKQRYGKDYPRKGWARPLSWAFGVLIAFFLAVFVVAFLIGMANAGLAGTPAR